ncbi:MAG TPA: acetoin utilization protein AcuC [Dehalococcoidia bacterium]|nr:acetoin utilization protein AcuC [Dehalococcoidia bacterium]
MRRAAFVYDDALSRHVLRPDHPMRPVRLQNTYDLLRGYGAFDQGSSRLVPPRPATEEELRMLHTPEYIAAVRSFSLGLSGYDPRRFNFSAQGDNPIYRGMYEAAALSTGATLVAAELVASKQVEVAFNIAGGLHHAEPGHASGFCVFNDPAIAIKYFLAQGLRVAYVDIDAHHGDGVQHAFYDDPRVLTISTHESGRFLFPGTGFVAELGTGAGQGYSVNLPLYPYTDDEVYLEAFMAVAPPLLRAFAPDVLVTQLGIDSYHRDPLTHLQLTSQGYTAAVRELAGLGIPWLALGGGGYDLSAVARCWSLAYGVMLDVEWPDELPQGLLRQQGLDRLRDTEMPQIPAQARQDARRYAEESVAGHQAGDFPAARVVGGSVMQAASLTGSSAVCCGRVDLSGERKE